MGGCVEIFRYSVPSYLRINEEKTVKRITNFIRNYIKGSGVAGVVLGLSGGSDSSVTAALAVRALGPSRVNALIMPDKESSPRSVSDAEHVARLLGIRYVRIDITPIVSSVLGAFGDDYSKAPKIPKGNVKARARMILLYYMANKENLIV
ncbi:MAG TPA: NAD(+) synthase, partial [Acidilobales archaeon]|nr:NAD(+) synthase [Acidilobales archaeon]